MIMSVSTFWMSSLAATPRSVVNLGMPPLPPAPAASAAAESPVTAAEAGATGSRKALLSPAPGSGECGSSRTSVSTPVTAAAAAMAGDIRWVRPPAPWRPSKLRLLVLAHRSPGSSLSGFMARHMEHPGSRQSKPASRNTASSPSASACCFTSPLPGTTIAYTPSATRRPLATAAAARMSSMRALVHEPMNTLSTGVPARLCPASRPMYSRARLMPAARSSSSSAEGSGTHCVMSAASWGDVPQVRVGAMSAASTWTSTSYWAPSSLARDRQ
mmetsp:Transcript_14615/g.41535  ORF Transcript_14615/g.41535 Transcript_14615/m.41535 type:complete len:272 (+) Transcript_14615:1106-1921(+)